MGLDLVAGPGYPIRGVGGIPGEGGEGGEGRGSGRFGGRPPRIGYILRTSALDR